MKSNPCDFVDYRLFYKKTGRAKYISHLDVMRCFQRAFKRSKLNFWFTEGFHPHLYLTFSLPLSLGYESIAESVDFRLTSEMDTEEIRKAIGETLPEGFEAVKCSKPVMAPKEIKYADYSISFICKNSDSSEKFAECFGRDEIIVLKKTKRGESNVDLKPLISLSDIKQKEDSVSFNARLVSGVETNINPELLFEAFRNYSGYDVDDISVMRTQVYNEKMQIFQ